MNETFATLVAAVRRFFEERTEPRNGVEGRLLFHVHLDGREYLVSIVPVDLDERVNRRT